MRRSPRSTRWLAAAVVACCAAILGGARRGHARSSPTETRRPPDGGAAHKCLVMTGSGDPAFIKNFNPYTATGLPSGQFVQGAFYEPLIVTRRGRPQAGARGSRAAGSGATATRR